MQVLCKKLATLVLCQARQSGRQTTEVPERVCIPDNRRRAHLQQRLRELDTAATSSIIVAHSGTAALAPG